MNIIEKAALKAKLAIDEIIKKVEDAFNNTPDKLWLTGYTQEQLSEAASRLRSEMPGWSISIDNHGPSGSYLKWEQQHFGKFGSFGDH